MSLLINQNTVQLNKEIKLACHNHLYSLFFFYIVKKLAHLFPGVLCPKPLWFISHLRQFSTFDYQRVSARSLSDTEESLS